MKITYMLWNQSCVGSEISIVQAWKWILHLEHENEIYLIFENLKQKIDNEKLVLLNLQIDQKCSSDYFKKIAFGLIKESVIYDEFMPVARTISTHTETDSIVQ